MCFPFFGYHSPPPPPEPALWLSEDERRRQYAIRKGEERAQELKELYAKRDKIVAKRNFWLRLAIRTNILTAFILEVLRGKRI